MNCPVCFKAGYPKEVYTSHWLRETRDKHSRVVCPVIKNMVCKRCFKKGHGDKTCKVRLDYDKPVEKKMEPTSIISRNKFDFGESDSESEEETYQKTFPKLGDKCKAVRS